MRKLLVVMLATVAIAEQLFEMEQELSDSFLFETIEEAQSRLNLEGSDFVYPDVMGEHLLGACSGAPACGTTMATFNGVAAKSNGANHCTGNSCGGYGTYGSQYQCVELA